ncbi:unnamed protein product [Ixodes pacificus]
MHVDTFVTSSAPPGRPGSRLLLHLYPAIVCRRLMAKRASNSALCSQRWAVYSYPALALLKQEEGRLLREEFDPPFLTCNKLRALPGCPLCVSAADKTRHGWNGLEKKRTTGERVRCGGRAGTR